VVDGDVRRPGHLAGEGDPAGPHRAHEGALRRGVVDAPVTRAVRAERLPEAGHDRPGDGRRPADGGGLGVGRRPEEDAGDDDDEDDDGDGDERAEASGTSEGAHRDLP
jgi:hypothetical protein